MRRIGVQPGERLVEAPLRRGKGGGHADADARQAGCADGDEEGLRGLDAPFQVREADLDEVGAGKGPVDHEESIGLDPAPES